ncbi:MAG: phenylalanine--tRNA ligase subunit beta [Candidatus Berkelbacteria bacterium]|nr:phenylalanine--tRNA ligase subunit beta [Candidatus Berkelbacteria bacterium]
MKIIKSWLQDYIDLDLENEKLADLLSLSGTAVDSFGEVLDSKVVVAEIREVKKHPNADKLQIATVWNGEEELQIVCGAPNIAPCQKVPLAQIGSVLGEGFVIKKAEIRGIESSGMLCAADELGLGSDHSGIMILDSKWEIGQPLNKYIKSDAVFDIEITPNRGDLLSHIGVARELKALLKKELKKSNYELKINKEAKEIEISVVDSSLCPQYYGLKISGVKPAESPKWLKDRLTSSGFRPINNIVDVTNYILLDLGQPLHAFDATKLKGGINIRPAHFGEGIVTLDGNLRALDEGMIVIADREEAIAIAGVMGGSNSEVDDKTSEIIIEAAEFERRSIRKTAKNLNLSSDASYRFERGIDSGNIENALKKAATLILEVLL